MGTIENEYRVFQMEVLAGPPCLDTEVFQHGARFRLNFGEVRGRQMLWHPQRAVWSGMSSTALDEGTVTVSQSFPVCKMFCWWLQAAWKVFLKSKCA